MRVSVIGTSGSGKTTFAGALAAALGAPHVDLDAINWQAGWRDLNQHDPDEFRRRVADAVAADAWVSCGNYQRSRSTTRSATTARGERLKRQLGPERWEPTFQSRAALASS